MREFCIFSVILFALCVEARKDSDVAMVADVISAMGKPSSVIATVCWPSHKKIQLYSALTSNERTQVSTVQILQADTVSERHSQDQHIVFIADLSCSNIVEYFQMSSAKDHFRSPFRWVLVSKDNSTSIVPEPLEDIAVYPDAEVIVARPLSNSSYDLYFVYKTGANASWRVEFYGIWDEDRRLQKKDLLQESTASRRMDLSGLEIPVGYVLTDSDSINHLVDGVNDHLDTLTKANFQTTNYLLDFLNASRRYVFVDTWGYNVNGTWSGMTGNMVRKEIEIGGSPMFFTSERILVVDYITSPTPTRSKFVFQQPKLSYTNNLFLLSFRDSVWYSILGLLLLMLLALLAVVRWEWRKYNHDELMKTDATILRGNVQDVSLYIFGAACQQGSHVELKGYLGRIVIFIIFLNVIFLYTSYAANIVALLQSSSTQIKTLEDLLHSRLKFGVHDTIFNRYYFSTATEPTRKAIYETKVAPPRVKPHFITMEEGVKSIQKGLFAFHMEVGVGYKFVGKFFHEGEKCALMEIQYLQVMDPYLAVRKNTPYKEMFKIGYNRIQEHGLQKRENQLLYQKRPKCSGRESNFISVSMVDCYPALIMWTYGLIISIIFLILEVLIKKRDILERKVCCRA